MTSNGTEFRWVDPAGATDHLKPNGEKKEVKRKKQPVEQEISLPEAKATPSKRLQADDPHFWWEND